MTSSQLRDMLVLNILGAGLLCVPYIAADSGGFAVTAIGISAALLYALTADSTPLRTRSLNFLYFIKTIIVSAMLLRIFSELISVTLLHETGTALIGAAMLLTALYGSGRGSAARGRMAQLFTVFTAAVLIISLLLSLKNADLSRLLPLPLNKNALIGAALISLMFFPIEELYFEKTCTAKGRPAVQAVLISGAVLLSAVLVRQLCFNTGSDFPVIDLSYNGIFSNTAARHQEGLLLLCITVLVYFALSSQLYCAAAALEGSLKTKHGFALSALPVFLLSLLPRSMGEARILLYAALAAGGLIFLAAVPVFHRLKKILPLAALLLLTGCTGCEPEAREYVLGMFVGADKITLAAAKLSESGGEVNKSVFYSGSGETFAAALHDINGRTGKELYMGHTVLCAAEKAAIDKDRLSALTTLFQSDDDLSRGVAVIAVDSIDELKDAKWGGGDIVSFIREYVQQRSTLEANSLLYTLTETDGDAVIPVISCKNNEIKIDGGAVIKDYSYAGDIDKKEFEALQWLLSDKNETVINTDGSAFSFRQKGVKKSVQGKVTFTVRAQARLVQGSRAADRQAAESRLAADISAVVKKIQQEYNCDCLETVNRYARINGSKTDFRDIPVNIVINTEWKGI